jgi:hypothetical protein
MICLLSWCRAAFRTDIGQQRETTVPRLSASESELAHRTPQRDFSPQGDGAAGIYVAAALGTAVAGGLFPLAIMLVVVASSLFAGGQLGLHDVSEMILPLAGGFIIGFFVAGLTAFCIFPLVGVLDWVASLGRWRSMLVSCAGGWCGFASVTAITQGAPNDEGLALAFGAMAMGQIGAGSMVRRLARSDASLNDEGGSPKKSQMPLRQLFGITTAVAIAAAVLAALPIMPQTYAAMAFAAASQAAFVAGYLLIRKVRRGESGDLHSIAPNADVPRETIALNPLD